MIITEHNIVTYNLYVSLAVMSNLWREKNFSIIKNLLSQSGTV